MLESSPYILNSDAIFIADSHFKGDDSTDSSSKALLDYFDTLLTSTNMPSQIFLMGDIANLLLGALDSSIAHNKALLEHIALLSQRAEVWWLEGNHDFYLNALQNSYLSQVRIVSRKHQPLCFTHKDSQRHIFLAHGDIFLPKKYELYIGTMTSKCMQYALKWLDYVTFGKLYNVIVRKVNNKIINIGNMDIIDFANKRILAYKHYMQNNAKSHKCADNIVIIEGHFHIGQSYVEPQSGALYIALPSFYVNRSIFSIESALDSNTKELC